MTALVRALDALAALLGAAILAVLATGGGTVAGLRLTRAEDLLVAAAVVGGARALARPYRLPAPRPARLVAAAVALYALAFSFIAVTRHFTLQTHALDLGQYLQVIWSIAAGHGAYTTLPPLHFWGEHFSPVFYLLAPLEWLAPGAPVLLVAQAVILALGALAVYAYAAPRLAPRAAAGLALLYLVNPSLHGINIRDIHPAAFVIPLVLGAAVAFDRRRYAWCALALALVFACREDAAVAVVGFGAWLALARRHRAVGAILAALAVGVLVLDLQVVMPHFRGAPYPHLHRYAHLGSWIGEILLTLALKPWRWLGLVLWPAKLAYLVALLAPLGLLPLLAPAALAAALPGLAMNLLSLDPVLFNYRSQYQAFVLPFLVLGAVDGYARLGAVWPARAGRILGFAFLASAVLTARTVNDFTVTRWRPTPAQRAALALTAQVPATAGVSANERMVPHLATRGEVHIYPAGLERSEWVLILEGEAATAPPVRFGVVQRAGGWVLLRRGA